MRNWSKLSPPDWFLSNSLWIDTKSPSLSSAWPTSSSNPFNLSTPYNFYLSSTPGNLHLVGTTTYIYSNHFL